VNGLDKGNVEPAQIEDQCYFEYGFGSRMVPCCLKIISREEYDRLVEEDVNSPRVGGAIGKHQDCPKNAEVAHQILSGRQQIESSDSGKAERLCKDVTFGECPISKEKTLDTSILPNIERCQRSCFYMEACDTYRFNSQTLECTLMAGTYKSLCKIRAAPMEKQASSCLRSLQPCDAEIEEDCEYTGDNLMEYAPGVISDAEKCQDSCQAQASTCKYWIYNDIEKACILKGDAKRICNVFGGPKYPSYEACRRITEDLEK